MWRPRERLTLPFLWSQVDDIGDVTITNDGATILKQLDVEHPAAKVSREAKGSEPGRAPEPTTSSSGGRAAPPHLSCCTQI